MSERKLWSEMSPHELLDMAQEAYENNTIPEMQQVLVTAAQVQAMLSLGWTFENRLAPSISNAIWEGTRR